MSSSVTTETATPKSSDGPAATSSTDTPTSTEPAPSSAPAEAATDSSNLPATETPEGLTTQPPISSNRNEEGLIREMRDFDSLLRMLSIYRDNPDIRGNSQDKNIEEIARVLSNFIGDDVDNFLSDEDSDEDGHDVGDDQKTNNHDSNNCC